MFIHSIYESISGEVSSISQGKFVTILRISGCNLSCEYCDALDARDGFGKELSIEEIAYQVKKFNNSNILITGGEPLLQYNDLKELIADLFDSIFFGVTIETNGTINPYQMPFFDGVTFVMDYKMPFSGCFSDMKIKNFLDLKRSDIIKFVCDSEFDVKTSIEVSNILKSRDCIAKMAIGQTWRWFQKKNFDLVKYLIDTDNKHFIINFQLHKILGCE